MCNPRLLSKMEAWEKNVGVKAAVSDMVPRFTSGEHEHGKHARFRPPASLANACCMQGCRHDWTVMGSGMHRRPRHQPSWRFLSRESIRSQGQGGHLLFTATSPDLWSRRGIAAGQFWRGGRCNWWRREPTASCGTRPWEVSPLDGSSGGWQSTDGRFPNLQ